MKKLLIILAFFTTLLFANDAQTIIKKLEKNLRGTDVYSKIEMLIKTKRHSRSMLIESWGKGKKKNFTKILSPSRDHGITFLNLDKQMWQYIPKIERIVKIPPSMMLQSWMGTDFTNDDMVKQSSLVDDYKATVIGKKGSIVTIKLIPRRNVAVVWGKIISKIDTKYYTQVEDIFYDDDGKKVRKMSYSKVKKFGTHYVTTKMLIIPFDKSKKGNKTTIKILDAKFDQGIDNTYFSKQALKRYSR